MTKITGRLVEYLGDGVYAIFDGQGIWLHANDHENPTDKIYLEQEVLQKLDRFRQKIEKHTITIKTDKRCSNDCSAMDWNPGSVWCNLFGKELKWDKRYKANGYKRCAECRKAEFPPRT